MQNTIMIEKLARRGARIPSEHAADFFDSVLVKDAMTAEVITLDASDRAHAVRPWLASKDATAQHQGYPVMDGERLVDVVTRRDLLDDGVSGASMMRELVKRAPSVVSDRASLHEAADHLARGGVGRLPVVSDADGRELVGIITRSDLLGAHNERLDAGLPQSSPSPLARFRLAPIKRRA
jgi:CIC family chloride channel protein